MGSLDETREADTERAAEPDGTTLLAGLAGNFRNQGLTAKFEGERRRVVVHRPSERGRGAGEAAGCRARNGGAAGAARVDGGAATGRAGSMERSRAMGRHSGGSGDDGKTSGGTGDSQKGTGHGGKGDGTKGNPNDGKK